MSGEGISRIKLNDLLQQIMDELGTTVQKAPGRETSPDLPAPLRDFYRRCGGLHLPFCDIWTPENSETDQDQRKHPWVVFGADGYFSYLLCHTEKTDGAFAIWDHETEETPEFFFDSPEEMIENLYEEYVDRDDTESMLVIRQVPAESKLSALQILRPLKQFTSAEWLLELRKEPVEILRVERSDGMRAVRALREMGLTAWLRTGPGSMSREKD